MPKPVQHEVADKAEKPDLTIDGTAELAPPDEHPLVGWLQGTVTVPDGVDLTEPACPEWPDLIEQKWPGWSTRCAVS